MAPAQECQRSTRIPRNYGLVLGVYQRIRNDSSTHNQVDKEECKDNLEPRPLVLKLPDFNSLFEEIIDASEIAIGGVLQQEGR